MFERAIAADPGYAPAYAGLADCHAWIHQSWGGGEEDLEAAERASRKALELAPDLAEAHASSVRRGRAAVRRGDPPQRESLRRLLLLRADLLLMGREQAAKDAIREGIRRVERQLELNPSDARALSLGGTALYEIGERERGMRWSERALELYPDEGSVVINCACLRAKAGLKEEAIDLLERAFARGWGKRDWIEHDPDYDSLRDDPRFQALLAKLH
jgi:adenylate cyclase